MNWKRRLFMAALGGLYLDGSGSAVAQDKNPFVGLWSGALVDEGQMSRYRLSISSTGQAALVFLETGGLSLNATMVELPGPRVHLAWPNYDLSLDGWLGRDGTIDAILTQGGVARPLQFSRGDLFPRTPLTPPASGPMTPALLRALRGFTETPAMGVGWMNARGERRALVDGLRSADAAAPVARTDKWQIGSCTKSMVAVLVARLVDAGRLRWDQTIGQVFGAVVSPIQPSYREATFVHLLSHRAGLGRDLRLVEFRTFTFGRMDDPRAERLRYTALVLAASPTAAPGREMRYSNAGYIVAAAMVEALMGAPWEILMAEYVFQPLGLRSAGFGPPAKLGEIDQPSGHLLGVDGRLHPPTTLEQADLPTAMAPAGDVHANLDDLLTYLQVTRDRPTTFLSESSWTTLQTSQFGDDHALGWNLTDSGGLTHDGGNGLWLARLAIERPSGRLCAVLFNGVTPQIGVALEQASAALTAAD